MNKHEEIKIASAILTDRAPEPISLEFVVGYYEAFRKKRVPRVPAAIMARYVMSMGDGGAEAFISCIHSNYDFYRKRGEDPIVAACLATTATSFPEKENRNEILRLYKALEGHLGE